MEQKADTKTEPIVESENKPVQEPVKKPTEEENFKQRAEQLKIAREVAREGKGRLKLKMPIHAADKEFYELAYDFSTVTGMEYIKAMDSDPGAAAPFGISSKQAITLFAIAAAKHTEHVDMEDILRDLFITDTIKAEELAKLFFAASSAEGNQRISKM